jgi:hypothetical protein
MEQVTTTQPGEEELDYDSDATVEDIPEFIQTLRDLGLPYVPVPPPVYPFAAPEILQPIIINDPEEVQEIHEMDDDANEGDEDVVECCDSIVARAPPMKKILQQDHVWVDENGTFLYPNVKMAKNSEVGWILLMGKECYSGKILGRDEETRVRFCEEIVQSGQWRNDFLPHPETMKYDYVGNLAFNRKADGTMKEKNCKLTFDFATWNWTVKERTTRFIGMNVIVAKLVTIKSVDCNTPFCL